jgi:tRNA/tmRNA/rRNA uracil-C5-methylase (TrmA/RlmC/RlmD family)
MDVYVVEISLEHSNGSIWMVFEEAKQKVREKAELRAWEEESEVVVERDEKKYIIPIEGDDEQHIDIYDYTLR